MVKKPYNQRLCTYNGHDLTVKTKFLEYWPERATPSSTADLQMFDHAHDRLWSLLKILLHFQIYEEAGLHDDDYDIRKIIREIIPGQICSVTASDEEIRGLIAALEERWDAVST